MKTQHLIGRISDPQDQIMALRVMVEISVTEVPLDGHRDVEHRPLSGTGTRLSIMGGAWGPRQRDFEHFGQVFDDLHAVDELAPGWTVEDQISLAAILHRWHLNDTRAACAHMDLNALVREPDGHGGSRISTTANKCPVSDYRWGTAWLYEEIPPAVLREIERLQTLPKGNLPAWVTD